MSFPERVGASLQSVDEASTEFLTRARRLMDIGSLKAEAEQSYIDASANLDKERSIAGSTAHSEYAQYDTDMVSGDQIVDYAEAMFRIYGVRKKRAEEQATILAKYLINPEPDAPVFAYAPDHMPDGLGISRVAIFAKEIGSTGLAYVQRPNQPKSSVDFNLISSFAQTGSYPPSFIQMPAKPWCVDSVWDDFVVSIDFSNNNAITEDPERVKSKGLKPNLVLGSDAVIQSLDVLTEQNTEVRDSLNTKGLQKIVSNIALGGEDQLELSDEEVKRYLDDLNWALYDLLNGSGPVTIPAHLHGDIVDLEDLLSRQSGYYHVSNIVGTLADEVSYRAEEQAGYSFADANAARAAHIGYSRDVVGMVAQNLVLNGSKKGIEKSLGSNDFIRHIAIQGLDRSLGYAYKKHTKLDRVLVSVAPAVYTPKIDRVLRKAYRQLLQERPEVSS